MRHRWKWNFVFYSTGTTGIFSASSLLISFSKIRCIKAWVLLESSANRWSSPPPFEITRQSRCSASLRRRVEGTKKKPRIHEFHRHLISARSSFKSRRNFTTPFVELIINYWESTWIQSFQTSVSLVFVDFHFGNHSPSDHIGKVRTILFIFRCSSHAILLVIHSSGFVIPS